MKKNAVKERSRLDIKEKTEMENANKQALPAGILQDQITSAEKEATK